MDVIAAIALILLKMSGYVKIFKDKDGDKDKNNKCLYVQKMITYI